MWFNFDKREVRIIKHGLEQYAATGEWRDLLDKIQQSQEEQNAPENKLWLEEAKGIHQVDGELELDEQGDGSVFMSRSDDGAYLMAWVWVSNDDMGICTECGAVPGTPEYGTVGDGHNGLCPSCADKAEPEEDEPVVLSPFEQLRKSLVDERVARFKAIEDADPDVGMPSSLTSMRRNAIQTLRFENKLPPEWEYPESAQ